MMYDETIAVEERHKTKTSKAEWPVIKPNS
jgi:hypothetical protein